MYTTHLAVGVACFFAAILGAGIFGAAALTGSGVVMGITGIGLVIAGIWLFLRTTLFAWQQAALEGRTAFDALRGSNEVISANASELIGGKAIGLFFAVNFMERALARTLATIGAALIVPILGPDVGVFALILIVMMLTAPARVYRNATWTALYLRGRNPP
jgi:hypothetical protein